MENIIKSLQNTSTKSLTEIHQQEIVKSRRDNIQNMTKKRRRCTTSFNQHGDDPDMKISPVTLDSPQVIPHHPQQNSTHKK